MKFIFQRRTTTSKNQITATKPENLQANLFFLTSKKPNKKEKRTFRFSPPPPKTIRHIKFLSLIGNKKKLSSNQTEPPIARLKALSLHGEVATLELLCGELHVLKAAGVWWRVAFSLWCFFCFCFPCGFVLSKFFCRFLVWVWLFYVFFGSVVVSFGALMVVLFGCSVL